MGNGNQDVTGLGWAALEEGVQRCLPWGLVLLLLMATGAVVWERACGRGRDRLYDRQVAEAARRYLVDPALIKAVIWKESSFQPEARGKAGEIGLMQLREAAAMEWSVAEGVKGFAMEHLLDPRTNVLAGSWYLGRLLRRYEGTDDPTPYALADYNAGRANVRKWMKAGGADMVSQVFIEQIGFPSTRRYVQEVMSRRKHYR